MANTLLVSNWGHAEQLKEWRKNLRLRQDEVAERIGVSRGGYANYESGTAPIPDDRLKKLKDLGYLARGLKPGKSVKEEKAEYDAPDAADAFKDRGNIIGFPPAEMPYAGVVPAGEWSDPFESDGTQEVDWTFYRSNRWCAHVDGLSCYPALQPGDFVIFEQTFAPPHNRIVIAQRKGDHGATVKNLEWLPKEGRSSLQPLNSDYEEPEADGWGAIAMLVYVRWTNRFGAEIAIYRKEGITAEELREMRPA